MSLVCFQTIARACMARESTRTLTAENFYEYVMRIIRNFIAGTFHHLIIQTIRTFHNALLKNIYSILVSVESVLTTSYNLYQLWYIFI